MGLSFGYSLVFNTFYMGANALLVKKTSDYIINKYSVPSEKHTKVAFLVDEVIGEISKVLNNNEINKLSLEKLRKICEIWNIKKAVESGKYSFFKKLITFKINFFLDIGRFCNHSCNHCLLEASSKNKPLNLKKFVGILDSKIEKRYFRFIRQVNFLGGEIFEYKDIDYLLKFFLENKVFNFSVLSRGPSKNNIESVINKIKILKETYPKFNMNLTLSFDFYSSISEEEILQNLFYLFYLNAFVFKNKRITLNLLLVPSLNNNWVLPYKEKRFLDLFISLLHNKFFPKSDLESCEDGVKIGDYFIKFRYNYLLPEGRAKKFFNEMNFKSFDDHVDFPNCVLLSDPFYLILDYKYNLKACPMVYKDVYNFNYGNILKDSPLQNYLHIITKYFKSLTMEDLLGKTSKKPCMVSNFFDY